MLTAIGKDPTKEAGDPAYRYANDQIGALQKILISSVVSVEKRALKEGAKAIIAVKGEDIRNENTAASTTNITKPVAII